MLVGPGGEVPEDEALTLRNKNRVVIPELLEINKLKGDQGFNYSKLDERLTDNGQHNQIYFANTVDRIQQTYDRLIQIDIAPERIFVLHNRMPHAWRTEIENKVRTKFGENALPESLILLTNQVAEAGLNISAPLVITDPAPVDTLVQRAGRCARWFRNGETKGHFVVISVPGLGKNPSKEATDYARPYQIKRVTPAIEHFPTGKPMSWSVEREWVNKAWGGGEKEAILEVRKSLDATAFALNLFDRAAQERQPGQIANAFREILSIEIAVEEGSSVYLDDLAPRDLQQLLNRGQRPDTSSISLARAQMLARDAPGKAAVIRYEEGETVIKSAKTIQLGDVLILPSSVAYLHRIKGLCFDDSREDAILQSEWYPLSKDAKTFQQGKGHRQGLSEHTLNVMEGAYNKLTNKRPYRDTLSRILKTLEKPDDVDKMLHTVAQIVCVAIAFHDLGKAHILWQKRVREFDPGCLPGLVGRSLSTGQRIGIPHTPPGFVATVEACQLLMGGKLGNAESLVRTIALASCRHHSSLFNPATIQHYEFIPHSETVIFVEEMLKRVGAPLEVIAQSEAIIAKSQILPQAIEVPLMLPNHDLFPLYALVGSSYFIGRPRRCSTKRIGEIAVIDFDWSGASQTLKTFGGDQKEFYVPKTGMPFFDALRLYGAIDLYPGLRDKITVCDLGSQWKVSAQFRSHQSEDRSKKIESLANVLKKEKLSNKEQTCLVQLEQAIWGMDWPLEPLRNVSLPLDNPDSALKDGVRDTAASSYKGLETGFGKESKVAFADALLALSGQKRTENSAGIYFLPIFEGEVDFSKVVSPLRAWTGIPNLLCAQVLMLLALKTSLFAEGYADRLSAVVYNTDLDGRKFFNYSGIISIQSTALAKSHLFNQDITKQTRFIDHFYRTFQSLIGRAWDRERGYKSKPEVEDAYAHAYWLLQPNRPKHLSSLVTSLERQKRNNRPSIAYNAQKNESYVKEIFQMSYGSWQGDHQTLRKFAKAVASGIYFAREADKEYADRGKAWYDEATMLRSAPSAKAFIERAMILVEQGKRINTLIGSDTRQEDFNPGSIVRKYWANTR